MWSSRLTGVKETYEVAMTIGDMHEISLLHIVHKLVVHDVLAVATHGYYASSRNLTKFIANSPAHV
jgi:hypothetical protein